MQICPHLRNFIFQLGNFSRRLLQRFQVLLLYLFCFSFITYSISPFLSYLLQLSFHTADENEKFSFEFGVYFIHSFNWIFISLRLFVFLKLLIVHWLIVSLTSLISLAIVLCVSHLNNRRFEWLFRMDRGTNVNGAWLLLHMVWKLNLRLNLTYVMLARPFYRSRMHLLINSVWDYGLLLERWLF